MGNEKTNTNVPRTRSIDGFTRLPRGQKATTVHLVAKPVRRPAIQPMAKKPASKPAAAAQAAKPDIVRPGGVEVRAHKQERASTLMRSAVSKPDIKAPSYIKATTRTDVLARVPQQTIVPKISYYKVDPVRRSRAERTVQNPAVSRYAKSTATSHDQAVSKLIAGGSHPVQSAAHYKGGLDGFSTPAYRSLQAAGKTRALPGSAATAVAAASLAGNSQPVRSAGNSDVFQKALQDARSHEQGFEPIKTRGSRRGRLWRYVVGSFVLIVGLGAVLYMNIPSLSLQVASYKAGLHAKMPSSQPSGYNYSNVAYQPGNVTVNYASPAGQGFNITQKASNWDSQGLLNNFVASATGAYQTYQKAGRTVYVLADNTATWVDSGVWYTVNGNNSLSASQLLDLAGSM